ncbi:hypothetical protein [Candidatus Sororendozoicomonas aggregata]|uniref:hypothetical protein n=1 Tax=Candidatus Sororendozoicomonas aggregata TaxID=3073239 RepID=UPI002ED44A7F
MKLRRSDGDDDNQAGDSVMIKPFVVVAISSVLCALVSVSASAKIKISEGYSVPGPYVQLNPDAQIAIAHGKKSAEIKKAICSYPVYAKYLCRRAGAVISQAAYWIREWSPDGRGCLDGNGNPTDMQVFPVSFNLYCPPFPGTSGSS